MFFYNAVVYCVLLLCAKVAISNEEKKKPVKDRGDDVKHTFAKLLKKIVTVNEERMQAMEKIIRLQDHMLTKHRLKNDDEAYYDSMEEEDTQHLLAFVAMPQLRRTEAKTITRAMCTRFNLRKGKNHLWTSQLLKMACHSHSLRLCERVCKKIVGRLCEKFHCNQNTLNDLQSECHGSCANYSEHNKV